VREFDRREMRGVRERERERGREREMEREKDRGRERKGFLILKGGFFRRTHF
jgi:hypothetical protein